MKLEISPMNNALTSGEIDLIRHQDIRFRGMPLNVLSIDDLKSALAQALDQCKATGTQPNLG
jgi:hypothetical protein